MNQDVEFEVNYMDRLRRIVSLAVWDNEGKMYSPIWGYDNQIVAYAPMPEAVELFNTWVTEHENT